MRTAVLLAALTLPGAALACGGSKTASADAETKTQAAVAKADASACAKKAELVGGACSYSTGMMAQRVLEKGEEFSFTGTLAVANEELSSKVAAPFVVANDIRVIANQVVEAAAPNERLSMHGKLLEVEGVKYFVLTEYGKASS